MAAIGVRHIDFMVLDVEGSELPVQQTVDLTRLSVDVFSIKYKQHLGKLKQLDRSFNRTLVTKKSVFRPSALQQILPRIWYSCERN